MSVEIGNFVTFFGLEEEFDHVNFNQINDFVDGCNWYKVEDAGDTWLDVRATDGVKTIHVNEAYDEYQVYTKESLRQHLKILFNNSDYAAICTKVKQLYRKYNNSDSHFKFQGV
jgi:hypothetical protein